VAEWPEASEDQIGRAKIQELVSALESKAREHGGYHDFKFPNDAGWWQDAAAGFGTKSVAKLREAACKYDPEGVMQLQRRGFLLRDM
jgi:hypothetical protein